MRAWLKDARRRAELTESETAKRAGIAQPFYHCIETGEKNPSVNTAMKIAGVLEFDWTRFFESEGKTA